MQHSTAQQGGKNNHRATTACNRRPISAALRGMRGITHRGQQPALCDDQATDERSVVFASAPVGRSCCCPLMPTSRRPPARTDPDAAPPIERLGCHCIPLPHQRSDRSRYASKHGLRSGRLTRPHMKPARLRPPGTALRSLKGRIPANGENERESSSQLTVASICGAEEPPQRGRSHAYIVQWPPQAH
jgi:hypothetical protein